MPDIIPFKRSQPRLVTFVQAVMSFKRLAKTMKKWRHYEDRHAMRVARGKSAIFHEVFKTNMNIKRAAGGYHVIEVHPNDIKETRIEMKRNQIWAVKERQRAADEQHLRELEQKERIGLLQNLTLGMRKGHFAETMNEIHESLDKALYERLEAISKENEDSSGNAAEVINMFNKHALNKDGKARGKKGVRDKTDYLPGTTIYYGSTVALQARHGGYLSYSNNENVKASAHKILPYARYVVLNCDDPSDSGLLRFGDAVCLQAGVHEVMGADWMPEEEKAKRKSNGTKMGNSEEKYGRMIMPALVNNRKENAHQAHQKGRWIVLHKDKPLEMLGEYVTHMDSVLFEQGWLFMASATPYDSFVVAQGTFEEVKKGEINAFDPGQDAAWKMHLVSLPGDSGAGGKTKAGAEVKAYEQLENNKEFRMEIQQQLMGTLEESLPKKLLMESVMVHQLGHKMNDHDSQHAFLKKYLVQSHNHFSTDKHDIHVLESVYGVDSFVVHLAKMRQMIHEQKLGNHELVKEMETRAHERHMTRKPKHEIINEQYWDQAAGLLLSTHAWDQLGSAMQKYYKSDFVRKVKASKVIYRFMQKVKARYYRYNSRLMRIQSDMQNSLTVRSMALKRELIRKGGKDVTEKEIQSQWEELMLNDMVPEQSSRLRKINEEVAAKNAKTEAARAAAKDKAAKQVAAQIAAREAHEKHRAILEAMHDAQNNRSSRKTKKEVEVKVVEARQDLAFKGFDTPIRPMTATVALKHSTKMSKVTAMPLPDYHQVYSELPSKKIQSSTKLPNVNNNINRPTTAAGSSGYNRLLSARFNSPHRINRNDLVDEIRSPILKLPEENKMNDIDNNQFFVTTLNDEHEVDGDIHTFTDADVQFAQSDGILNNNKSLSFTPTGERIHQTFNLDELAVSPERVFGLPRDVLHEKPYRTSLKSGLAFLRATSKNPKIYDDIKASKKSSKNGKSSKKSSRSRRT